MNSDPALLRSIQEQHPHLLSREQWGKKITGVALGSKNMKRMLQKAFPGVEFSVKSEIYSMGNCISISWNEFPESKIGKEVDALIAPFQSKTYHGIDDSEEYDRDPYRVAFRELYGSTAHVRSQPDIMQGEVLATYEFERLQRQSPPAKSTHPRSRM